MNHTPTSIPTVKNSATWGGLRQAITSTPGFQYWRNSDLVDESKDLDDLVQIYLRETLETLAY
jgi:hypothetical protein